MKQSVRAKRMERHHKRLSNQAKLSLVSLMDIFTILVFFLMLNASDVQVLQTHKSVQLPTSGANTPAKETLLLMVNNQQLVLQGQKLVDVDAVLASGEDLIAPLMAELTRHAQKTPVAEGEEQIGRQITIMGDQAVPYALLKKIMQTCAEAGYTEIALAVEHKEAPGGVAP
ncbi:biopolymer transporter ExbD [Aliiglaciecola sp. CAU 1673]|uniref:ExbD/TolR family protein n=1 Tax=Aliiglaciecola sp. CAU 1673 TaxID=3032595 RepID=UPI0023DBC6C0|nr:biopolymer transporter ExbD [Aliiglaciecola sp. CAU 1673]MDF2177851.1 biopolymer transporter ExbD [Aliiglaciecola sp. CAU 1673]